MRECGCECRSSALAACRLAARPAACVMSGDVSVWVARAYGSRHGVYHTGPPVYRVLSGHWADSSKVPLNSGALRDSSMTKPLAEPPSEHSSQRSHRRTHLFNEDAVFPASPYRYVSAALSSTPIVVEFDFLRRTRARLQKPRLASLGRTDVEPTAPAGRLARTAAVAAVVVETASAPVGRERARRDAV